MRINNKKFRTIWFEENKVKIIDQTKLPHQFIIKELKNVKDAINAIKKMEVRGAPLIGATAAYGLVLSIIEKNDLSLLNKSSEDLIRSRPTAINLKWAVDRMMKKLSGKNNKEILNFGPVDSKIFSIIKYNKFINLLEKKIKKKKLINFINKNKTTFYNSVIDNKNKFDLIINFNENNKISKELFFKKQYKNYNSSAYTTVVNHQKCDNRIAYQTFTKFGPIAFLPCSNKSRQCNEKI